MDFNSERELQIELANTEPSNWGHHNIFFVRREVPIGECIPDIICVGFGSIPEPTIWPGKWTSKHSFILWLLRDNGPLKSNEIADICFMPIKRIDPLLKDLIKSKAINRLENGEYNLSQPLLFLDAEVITIEAKLYRWQEAIDQAQRYKLFSDKVIVAMDALGIPKSPSIIKKFSDLKIGLCAVSPNHIEWLVNPGISQPVEGFNREYIINSALVPSRQTLWARR